MTWQQFLTERVLNEVWWLPPWENQTVYCNGVYVEPKGNRTFTTRDDMMDLYQAAIKKDLKSFYTFMVSEYLNTFSPPDNEEEYPASADDSFYFTAWLFNLAGDPAEYEARCLMVEKWHRERNEPK